MIVCLLQILLEKVGSILSKQTHAEGGAGGEGNDVESQSNTHSLQTALKQTQKMLSSTQQCTQAVLSSVTDTTWWKKTLNSIQHPIHDTAADKSMGDKNAAFTLQGCHPFYEGVIDKCYLDVVSFIKVSKHLICVCFHLFPSLYFMR